MDVSFWTCLTPTAMQCKDEAGTHLQSRLIINLVLCMCIRVSVYLKVFGSGTQTPLTVMTVIINDKKEYVGCSDIFHFISFHVFNLFLFYKLIH